MICRKAMTTKTELDMLPKYNFNIAAVSYGTGSLSRNDRLRGTNRHETIKCVSHTKFRSFPRIMAQQQNGKFPPSYSFDDER